MGLPASVGCPRLAAGVETREFGTYAIVASPNGTEHLHLGLDEFALLALLDGSRSLAELATLGGDTLGELLDDLWDGGFLDGAPAPAARRVTVTAQGIEFAGVDRSVRFLYRRVGRYAFSALGVVFFGTIAATGLAAFVAQAAGGRSLVLVGVSPVLALVALRALSSSDIVAHEMGHAMVIARHDRRVGRVGVGFYWGLLSFYVDATDALFMDRHARMLQAAAGCITDLVLCGIAALIALVLPDGHSRQLLLEFTALAYLSIVLQAVPLLELDGYWFLADVLDRPSLHADSTEALRQVLRREPCDRRLAAYAALSALFGVASLAAGAAIWWHLFGHLFHQLWGGNLLYKILAGYLVLPFIALAFQLLHRLRSRARDAGPPE